MSAITPSSFIRRHFVWMFFYPLLCDSAHPQINTMLAPLRFCSQYANSMHLSDDNNILCFDGGIRNDLNLNAFTKLNDKGYFVMRSPGGNIITAMQMANILFEKRAIVIIYDYCLSACANAIFVASGNTYVADNTIVAWHRGVPKVTCGAIIIPADVNKVEYKRQVDNYNEYCKHIELLSDFYKRRNIDDGITYQPPTTHTRQIFQLAVRQALNKNNVFWMWNPANFNADLKTKITFQSYPDSQEAVDQLIRRLRLPMRAIYDPPTIMP